MFADPAGRKKHDYASSNAVASVSADALLDQGDQLQLFHESTATAGELLVVGAGALRVPSPDPSGRCNDRALAGFEVSQRDVDCFRDVPSDAAGFASLCRYVLAPAAFSTSLRLGRCPSRLPSPCFHAYHAQTR